MAAIAAPTEAVPTELVPSLLVRSKPMLFKAYAFPPIRAALQSGRDIEPRFF
jgi:hypothetical protein